MWLTIHRPIIRIIVLTRRLADGRETGTAPYALSPNSGWPLTLAAKSSRAKPE
jgi:hypothetical protein